MSNLSFLGPVLIAGFLAARAVGKRGTGSGRSASGVKPVPLGHNHDDPELTKLRGAVTGKDWEAVAAILQPCRDRGDHSRLNWLIGSVDGLGGDFLLEIGGSRPKDALARTVCGARHVGWAWEARSGARASQVSREQFELFHQRLALAEEHLYAAAELDPDAAAPWYFLTTVSRGLEHGPEVTRRRFEAGRRRSPGDLNLHLAMLQQVCAKWSGSHEEMHAFAREARAQAAPGSSLGALSAHAHLEQWLDLTNGEDAAYITQPEVILDLRKAAAESVLHPEYAPTESPYPALNAFAMAFWLADDKVSARQLFELIGDRPTASPWQLYGDPGRVFATARQQCKKAK
ncbi:hypothetical protein CFP65_0504 [Kitasatospora sp. MMS16-BH015]|uniref:hypothetical protein n=1 Tax=Kitasatospora sp. MMS16-BH015 TaxID=2018025 RepID=UPI000CA094FA|nr:hypothetical protein [Kitasatospora sp. MMS16-BH015]AUG75467.1 hypothetical protein CFP65_0504 [Kitasatospora sp. MMS16-BH015]